jgi:hypothetical protein
VRQEYITGKISCHVETEVYHWENIQRGWDIYMPDFWATPCSWIIAPLSHRASGNIFFLSNCMLRRFFVSGHSAVFSYSFVFPVDILQNQKHTLYKKNGEDFRHKVVSISPTNIFRPS